MQIDITEALSGADWQRSIPPEKEPYKIGPTKSLKFLYRATWVTSWVYCRFYFSYIPLKNLTPGNSAGDLFGMVI